MRIASKISPRMNREVPAVLRRRTDQSFQRLLCARPDRRKDQDPNQSGTSHTKRDRMNLFFNRLRDARRYLVCVNEGQATKDRHDRKAVVVPLRGALSKGDK